MRFYLPRITISALRGGSGKTIVSLGLTAALREQGFKIATFKKGPDFIDAGWLCFASGAACFNLDPFLMEKDQIIDSFISHAQGNDMALIEGNRGLYDGMDITGSCSTAELSKLIGSPVLLIVDVTMVTRTIAALVKGCQIFDPEVKISGIILNRVAGPRQESLIRQSLEEYCDVKVVGAIPKLKTNPFPERHMGLVPHQEQEKSIKAIEWAKDIVKKHLDVQEIQNMAKNALGLRFPELESTLRQNSLPSKTRPKIGYIRDRAFWFYYPDNLSKLEAMGAELIEVNSLKDKILPPMDALYIGGGFPETQAKALAQNKSFREDLKIKIEKGLPVYAECGGLMFLGEELVIKEKTYPMVGVLPITYLLEKKPQGHGYTIMKVVEENPYYKKGDILKGHEFHYSRPIVRSTEGFSYVFKVLRGHGVDGNNDGLYSKNLLGTYTHIHAGGDERWAKGVFHIAQRASTKKEKNLHFFSQG